MGEFPQTDEVRIGDIVTVFWRDAHGNLYKRWVSVKKSIKAGRVSMGARTTGEVVDIDAEGIQIHLTIGGGKTDGFIKIPWGWGQKIHVWGRPEDIYDHYTEHA